MDLTSMRWNPRSLRSVIIRAADDPELRPLMTRERSSGTGTRIPVATVVGLVATGITIAETIAEYPQLTPDDVQACLGYAARAVDERELPVRLTA